MSNVLLWNSWNNPNLFRSPPTWMSARTSPPIHWSHSQWSMFAQVGIAYKMICYILFQTCYLAECHANNEIKLKDAIRCRECGHRVMYKRRTKRCKNINEFTFVPIIYFRYFLQWLCLMPAKRMKPTFSSIGSYDNFSPFSTCFVHWIFISFIMYA